ncbi:unnamed protein product [Miscanthus lutarioriparius]|uniref:Uncharacterized protein n=1 Tax=Miscanthus lutarioriparius TaxID=422564 RepID=A0A811RJ97_9POAL|nr:unnamed protein product [Miscanthus lutarioriparius]
MQTPQSLTMDQACSTSSLEISSKVKFALEASVTEVEISDTVQNLRKDNPKKRRRLILTGDDEDEEEKAEDVQQENVNHQPLKCNEPMVKDWVNTEYYYVEEAVQTGDFNDKNLINARSMKRRRRYIVENEEEDDIEGAESALNNASKWSLNDSAKMASQTPVATDHSLQSRPSDSEYADRQYHICLQPLDEPVWRQNEELTRLNRIIKSDDALQVTVGIAELLIFPSVLLAEQYHRERQHQEHDLLDQQDEALYDLLNKETFAVKHVVDAEDQLQVEGDPEGTKRWTTILMRCSFKNNIMAAGVLSDDAKDKVRSLGFGDLLDLTVESLQSRERIVWLAERCDVSSEGERFVIKINPGKSLEITPELVHDKLGIPRGCGDNNSCLLGSKLTAKEKMNEYKKLCNEMKEAGFVVDFAIKPKTKDGKKPRKEKETRIKLDIFIQYMKGIRDVDKQVKCFLCILMNRLLLPTTSDYITGENIAFCSDLERMEKQDWCKIVCQRLKDGISEWMRKKGKENASDAVPTGCTAVLLISYLDSLLPELGQEKPHIKHYSKEKLMKMLAQANEKDKMEKCKKDKKENEKDKMEKHTKDKNEKCKQKMYDNPKHKVQKQACMFFLPVNPVFTRAAFPFRNRSRT